MKQEINRIHLTDAEQLSGMGFLNFVFLSFKALSGIFHLRMAQSFKNLLFQALTSLNALCVSK